MKEFIHILLAFSISGLTACSSEPTKNLLQERAGYGVKTPPMGLNGSGSVSYVPTRIPERVAVAWLHAHELPSKDYFWGSWISVVVAPESWEMTKVAAPKTNKQKIPRTEARPASVPARPKAKAHSSFENR